MPGKRTLVNSLTDSILTSVKVSHIDQCEPENSICENKTLTSKIAERVIARLAADVPVSKSPHILKGVRIQPPSNIMKNVKISPLAGTNSPPSTQKPELLPYDIKCFENEEFEHLHYANTRELWESDPYVKQTSDVESTYDPHVEPLSNVKETYNKVMRRFVKNERNRLYEIKNYNITDETDGYKWYRKMGNKRVEANFSITIPKLETLLKEKATLPSRYSIYNFLDSYYCQLRVPQDSHDRTDIAAIYSHYKIRPPHYSLPVIWGLYYNIVSHFDAEFLGERAGSKDKKYKKLVERFIFMLTQFKKLKDEYPKNTFPENVAEYREEYYELQRQLDRSDDDSDDDDSGGSGQQPDTTKLEERAETLKNEYAGELNEIVNKIKMSVNKLSNSREYIKDKDKILSISTNELERLKKCQETLKNNPLSVEILKNDLEYLIKTELFDVAAALEEYIDALKELISSSKTYDHEKKSPD